jgi:hypothetical protein
VTHPVLRLEAPISSVTALSFAIMALPAAETHRVVWLGLFIVASTCAFLALPRKVEIGHEGIRIRPILGIGGKTIPYTQIRLAAPDGPNKLVVRTMENTTLVLHAGLFGTIPREVLDRFWSAVAAGAEDGSRGVERQALSRSGRTTPEWRVALRELARPATYRSATVSHDRLWTIAENPGLDVEIRGGAIVALSASALDENGRARLRRIDAATLHPTLHVLLDHAASGEPNDVVVDAALDALAR